MKNILIIVLATIIPTQAPALTSFVSCFIDTYPSSGYPTGCASASRKITCSDATYYDCDSCASGYTLSSTTVEISSTESYTYGTCLGSLLPIVQCPDECPDTVAWTDYGSYQAKCAQTTLSASCTYQCSAGYYGTSNSCTRCPSSGGVYGTSAAGSTSITSCYIPSGSSFSDSTGSGTYTGDCYYTE